MSRGGKLKTAVLISGRGSNLLAIAQACRDGRLDASIALVLSDRGDAAGLPAAAALGLVTAVIDRVNFATREAFETALAAAIDGSGAQLVSDERNEATQPVHHKGQPGLGIKVFSIEF